MLLTNNFIFNGLKIIAWIIFIGLCIEAGVLLVNFIFSIYNPDFAKNLYQNLDLSSLYLNNKWGFYSLYSVLLTISMLKALLFYTVVVLVTKIDLQKPFNTIVSKQILKISYYTFSIGIFNYLGQNTIKNFNFSGFNIDSLNNFSDSKAFVLMAAVIYVIAIIFAKGVEYQNELEETV